jgi:hypothetical protein
MKELYHFNSGENEKVFNLSVWNFIVYLFHSTAAQWKQKNPGP